MSYLPIRLPRLEVQQQQETPENSASHNQKTRTLRELYEQTHVIDEQLQYALFSQQITHGECHDKILEEAWSGTKTSVAHLIIFGFVAFSHVPD